MTEEKKLGRVLAKRAAKNGKCTTYLNKKLQVKIEGVNFTGDYVEKFVYSNGKVIIYDKDGKEIKEPKAEAKPKVKASQKLSNASDVQPSTDL